VLDDRPLISEEITGRFEISQVAMQPERPPEQISPRTSDGPTNFFMNSASTCSRFASTLTTSEDPADIVNNSVSDPQVILTIMPNEVCLFGSTQKNGQAIIEPEFQEKHLELPAGITFEHMKEVLAKIGVGIASKKARKPEIPNQDNILFFRTSDFTLFGIVDGHGIGGHWVSHWVARFALHLVLTDVSELGLKCLKDTQTMTRVFNLAHEALLKRARQENFDVELSGTTLCMCAVDHTTYEIYTSCVGDSGCVLSRSSGEFPEFVTVEHKPDDMEERRRIVERGGEVSDCRVWLRGQQIPGLAMSRSIGDEIGHRAGVTHQPSVRYLRLDSLEKTSRKNLFICGSDGVWDFMEPEEAVRIVNDFGPLRVAEAPMLSQKRREIVGSKRRMES